MDKNAKHYPLNVTMPQHCAYVVRDLPQATVEQRERALNATHWNEFAFPSGMLTVDMLSDSGTTAMTNQQWATLFLGDEAYGRNTGYYVRWIRMCSAACFGKYWKEMLPEFLISWKIWLCRDVN